MSKGIMHTLEAVLATLIILSFILIVSPALPKDTSSAYLSKDKAYYAFQALEKNQKLGLYAIDEDLNSLNTSMGKLLPDWMLFSVALKNTNLTIPLNASNHTLIIQDSSSVDYIEIRLDLRLENESANRIDEFLIWNNSGPLNVTTADNDKNINITTNAYSSTQLNVSVNLSNELSVTSQYKVKIRKEKRLDPFPSDREIITTSYIIAGRKSTLIPTEFIVYIWR